MLFLIIVLPVGSMAGKGFLCALVWARLVMLDWIRENIFRLLNNRGDELTPIFRQEPGENKLCPHSGEQPLGWLEDTPLGYPGATGGGWGVLGAWSYGRVRRRRTARRARP
jgi:hypothetical protein